MEFRDVVNLILTFAWVLAALACWYQPALARRRQASGRPSRGPVGPELRLVSAATCALLAVASFAAIPIERGILPVWVGQGLAAMGAVALLTTLVVLLRERLAGGR